MRIPLWVIVVVFVGLIPASAAPATQPDSVWWSAITDEEQTYATIGAQSGYGDGYIMALNDTNNYKGDLHHRNFAHHTVGFYKAAITDFYQTHPRAKNQTIGAILSCLADKPSRTCDEVAAEAEKYAP
jgi:hypothetical protein